ncbi:ArsR family transcriptional regulator [Haloferacaceae archaeon DSL9]
MVKERDEESGRYRENYPPDVFIEALAELGGAAGTQEVATEVGCAYRTAHAKLSSLEAEDRIDSRRVGNARLWLLDSTD